MKTSVISYHYLLGKRELELKTSFKVKSGEKATEATLVDFLCFSKTWSFVVSPKRNNYLAPGLWLSPVTTHNVLEGLVLFGDLEKNKSILWERCTSSNILWALYTCSPVKLVKIILKLGHLKSGHGPKAHNKWRNIYERKFKFSNNRGGKWYLNQDLA